MHAPSACSVSDVEVPSFVSPSIVNATIDGAWLMRDADTSKQAPVVTDLVSQIQEGVSGLCELFFNIAGSLQRDAHLASVCGEAVDNSGRAQKADVPALGQQVVEASKAVDALMARLPVLDKSEQSQLQEIADLMVRLIIDYGHAVSTAPQGVLSVELSFRSRTTELERICANRQHCWRPSLDQCSKSILQSQTAF